MGKIIKKVLIYGAIIAIPVGLIVIGLKYFYNSKNGKSSPEEMVADGMGFLKKVFKMMGNAV